MTMNIARAVARGRVLSRRRLFSSASKMALTTALLPILAACPGQSPVTPATGGGTTPTSSIGTTIAGWVQEIADGVAGIESKLGLSNTAIGQVTSLLQQLAGLVPQISGSSGSSLSSLFGDAEGVINLLAPFIPGGTLLTAILSIMNTARGLIGGVPSLARPAMAAAMPMMDRATAESILRAAAAGQLPR
jgi:hypothetical protein